MSTHKRYVLTKSLNPALKDLLMVHGISGSNEYFSQDEFYTQEVVDTEAAQPLDWSGRVTVCKLVLKKYGNGEWLTQHGISTQFHDDTPIIRSYDTLEEFLEENFVDLI